MSVVTRTCIGCRERASARELVRLLLVDGHVRPAPRAARHGRGASVHPREACVIAAVKTQAFARAFKAAVAPISPDFAVSRKNNQSQVLDDAVRAFIRDIEIAHVLQQPRAGRTP